MQKILFFQSIHKNRIWGGQKLQAILGRNIPNEKIGEAWDISDYEGNHSVILNGVLQGKTLRQALKQNWQAVMGKNFPLVDRFPLLVKIIDAEDILSVQVHPDDKQAQILDGADSGKKEFWIVIQSDPGAYLYCGFNRNTAEQEYRSLVAEGRAEEILQKFYVRKYDSFLLDPGTIHAIGGGILLLEIQETADLTYRVYDYNRKDNNGECRDLHLDKAMQVMNFNTTDHAAIEAGSSLHWDSGERILMASNDKFRVEKLEFSGHVVLPSMTMVPSFQIVSVLEGSLHVEDENRIFNKGESFMVTAEAMTKGLHLFADGEAVLVSSTAGSRFQELIK